MKKSILSIGLIEFIYAYLLGAPVKTRSGKVCQRYVFGKTIQKFLDPALFGIDISKWQGVVDFVKVKAMGIKFLIFRASYGIRVDEKFVEYITSAIGVFIGWLFGVYHYYDPQYSPQQQANVLLNAIRPYRKYIRRVWIDLEFTWSGNYTASSHWKAFAELILADGWLIGIYTRQTWWDSRVGTLSAWFAQFPLWAAQYSSALTLIPKGWTFASLWQNAIKVLGGPGTAFPQSYEIDHDIMESGFYQTETGGVVDPPPTGEPMEQWIEILAGYLNGRANAGGSLIYPAGSTYMPNCFAQGDIVRATQKVVYNGADWYGIVEHRRGDTVLPLPASVVWASAGASYTWMKLIEAPVPPPSGEPAVMEIMLADGSQVVVRDVQGNELFRWPSP